MTRTDREALRRALAIAKAKGGEESARLLEMERKDGWERAGRAAAFGLQCDALGLRPWEAPPCHTRGLNSRDFYGSRPKEVELLERLLANGISKYEPDVIGSLARAGTAIAS
jgi:hypothetical protein